MSGGSLCALKLNAHLVLGPMQQSGLGVHMDAEEVVVEWYRKAAEQGCLVPEGVCSTSGRARACSVHHKDMDDMWQAVEWSQKAAEQGAVRTHRSTSRLLLQNGEVEVEDIGHGAGCGVMEHCACTCKAKAASRCTSAQGHVQAQCNLSAEHGTNRAVVVTGVALMQPSLFAGTVRREGISEV